MYDEWVNYKTILVYLFGLSTGSFFRTVREGRLHHNTYIGQRPDAKRKLPPMDPIRDQEYIEEFARITKILKGLRI